MGDSFLRELLGRFLLLQAMDLLAQPDTVNYILLLLLNPDYFSQVCVLNPDYFSQIGVHGCPVQPRKAF